MENKETKKEVCGIIMPISGSENYSSDHWVDVKNLLDEVTNDAGFQSNLVSDADEIGIIHNRIVSNIYNNPIIICDVSSKNPNVMFELGLRLAFDKATIIIKDDITNYNFDTAPIEHLTYPKDLRYSTINKFKSKLKDKLTATYSASQKPDYSTFLKNFVQYKPKLEVEEISSQEYVLKQLDSINKQLSEIKRTSRREYTSEKYSSSHIDAALEAKFHDFALSQRPIKNYSKNSALEQFLDFLRASKDPFIMQATISDVKRKFEEMTNKWVPNTNDAEEIEPLSS